MSTVITPGQLNQRIRLEAPQYTDDGLGGVTTSWVLVAECWGKVETRRGRRRDTAQSRQAVIIRRLVIRARDDIDATMRVIINGQPHAIDWIAPYDDHGAYQLCELRQ